MNKTGNIGMTLRGVRVTNVAVTKQYILHIMSMCL